MAVQLPGGGALMIGNFINAVLNFFIMAFVVFCIVKVLNPPPQKGGGAPSPAPRPLGGGDPAH